VSSDAVAVGVNDPNFFSKNYIDPGYVWYVYTYQITGTTIRELKELTVVQQLGKYDVAVFSVLTATKGTRLTLGDCANAVGTGLVLSTCWTVPYTADKGMYGDFVPVVVCHVITTDMGVRGGDSGSPVYQLVYSGNVPTGVKAYGVISGKDTIFVPLPLPVTVVAPLDPLGVNVKR